MKIKISPKKERKNNAILLVPWGYLERDGGGGGGGRRRTEIHVSNIGLHYTKCDLDHMQTYIAYLTLKTHRSGMEAFNMLIHLNGIF